MACFRSLLAGHHVRNGPKFIRSPLPSALFFHLIFSRLFSVATWLPGLLQACPGAVLVPLREGQRHFSGPLRGSVLALIYIDAAEERPMGSEAGASRAGTGVEH